MYVTYEYSIGYKSGNQAPYYRIRKVTASGTVNSGTRMLSKELAICAVGNTMQGYFTTNQLERINILNEGNRTLSYALAYWDPVFPGSIGAVEASLSCNVARPSGESGSFVHTINLPLLRP